MDWRRTKESLFKSKFYMAEKGDFIFSKIDFRNGAFAIANKKIALSGEFPIYKISSDKLNPKYLIIILRNPKVLRWFDLKSVGHSGRKRVYPSLIENFEIPLPPMEIQNKIVKIMDNAYKLKKQKEDEAKKLLNSIDGYILNELGIKIPEIKEKNSFIVNIEDILKNKRLDVEFNKEKYRILMDAIEKGKYETVEVGKVFKYIKKGIEVGSSAYVGKGIPFIRVSNIDDYKIHYENADKKIKPELYKELKDKYKPQIRELLYSKDGTIGFCVMVEEDRDFIISGGILRLKVEDSINPYYIKAILSTKLLKTLAEQRSIGAVIKHLRETEFKKLKIPLPPKEIQEKIAKEVGGRIKKAQQLKEESKKTIEDAKKEVEKIFFEGWE
jgi:restriction endonuclease S subunit